jgi:hypothetical protein
MVLLAKRRAVDPAVNVVIVRVLRDGHTHDHAPARRERLIRASAST